jgi:single-strand DNA-binding protein
MRSINKQILIGVLGKDAETTFTQGGTAITKFSLATANRFKDKAGEWKEETDWFSIVLFGAESLSQYLTKGKQVYVEGRTHNYSYEDKSGTKRYASEVRADQVLLLDRKGDRTNSAGAGGDQGGFQEDDIPF